MKDLIAFSDEGSQGAATHLEPAGALLFVVGGGESARLQNCLLVRIVVHIVVGDLKKMFVVRHSSVVIR